MPCMPCIVCGMPWWQHTQLEETRHQALRAIMEEQPSVVRCWKCDNWVPTKFTVRVYFRDRIGGSALIPDYQHLFTYPCISDDYQRLHDEAV